MLVSPLPDVGMWPRPGGEEMSNFKPDGRRTVIPLELALVSAVVVLGDISDRGKMAGPVLVSVAPMCLLLGVDDLWESPRR